MEKGIFTFLIGGKAGEGVKKAGSVASQIFNNRGLRVFQMDDYMSLIRGGHNFSVVSTTNRWISSHYMKADLIVNFDKRSCDIHKKHLSEGGLNVYNSDEIKGIGGIGVPLTSQAKKYPAGRLMFGVGAIAILAASIGLEKEELNSMIKKEYGTGLEDNLSYANIIYELIFPKLGNRFSIKNDGKKRPIITGNQAICLGAVAGGLDVYYGYPMTPASSILHYLASQAENFGLAVVHAESEISVINMAIGSSFTGAKAMVGTSGGGFALMVEGLSLAGMAEAPVLCVLSMRPGPATGVPTYTEQADLFFALNAGHGEFLRIVACPSTVEEAYYLTAEMLDLIWKFQTPGILLTEKHLSESWMTVDINVEKAVWAEPIMHTGGTYKRYLDTPDGISPMLFPPSKETIKWTSYEHDELGITTEEPELIAKMHEKRDKKNQAIVEYLRKRKTLNVYGDKGPVIISYGSTTMSVLEALNYGSIEAKVIQPIYLNPFPVWELENFKDESIITVELSKEGQFTRLIKEKCGIKSKALINQYDGRPFDPIDLSNKIKEVI
ncbi:MAG: 2-oxoacid:acceptor oxidoreductase subunit alpha [Candidatus Hodarchaeota archaeon]